MPVIHESERRSLPGWPLVWLLLLGTVALYWPATGCAFVNFDDNLYVTANAAAQSGLSLAGLKWDFIHPVASNWHPVTMLSHQWDCQWFGLHPRGHHWTSVLLHALNVALVFGWLRQLTGAKWRSFGVAVLFAVHPLHVESVAWVAERKDVLSAFFGLLTLIFYARYTRQRAAREGSDLEPGRRPKPPDLVPNYLPALLFFTLGLMCKAMLVTWPFVLLLLDYWPLGRFQPGRAWGLVREKIPFILLSALMCVVTLLVQQHAGAVAAAASLPPGARIANALVSYYRYLGKFCLPTHLAVFYPLPAHWPVAGVLTAGGWLAALSVVFFGLRWRQPFWLMGWLWFLGTLVPVIGLVQVGEQSMADRYAYLPSLGILIPVVWGAAALTRGRPYAILVVAVVGAAVVLLDTALTRRQLGYWRDSEALFRHDLAIVGDNHIARNNLGAALVEKGRIDEAILQYQAALRLQPEEPSAHFSLGNALSQAGQFDDAIRQYQAALRRQPDYAEAMKNLGGTYYKQGNLAGAITQFQAVLQLQAGDPTAHYNLGKARFKQGDTNGAALEYQAALHLNPNYAEAHNNLGYTLQAQGHLDEAIRQYEEALRLNPDYALAKNNLAAAQAEKKRPANP
jgi:tetratricopeptide (TPR) repeat protein